MRLKSSKIQMHAWYMNNFDSKESGILRNVARVWILWFVWRLTYSFWIAFYMFFGLSLHKHGSAWSWYCFSHIGSFITEHDICVDRSLLLCIKLLFQHITDCLSRVSLCSQSGTEKQPRLQSRKKPISCDLLNDWLSVCWDDWFKFLEET